MQETSTSQEINEINNELEREENIDLRKELLDLFPPDFDYQIEKISQKMEQYRVLGAITGVKFAALLNSDEETDKTKAEIDEYQQVMVKILKDLDELCDYAEAVDKRYDKLLKAIEEDVGDGSKSTAIVEQSMEVKEAEVVDIDFGEDDNQSTPRITESPRSVLFIDSETSEDKRSVITINLD